MTDTHVTNVQGDSYKQTIISIKDETDIDLQDLTIEPSGHGASVKQDQDIRISDTHLNIAVMTDRNISNGQSDSDKPVDNQYLTTDPVQLEESPIQNMHSKQAAFSIQPSQHETSMKQDQDSNKASGSKKYMIIGIIISCIFSGASICFSAMALKNSVRIQGSSQHAAVSAAFTAVFGRHDDNYIPQSGEALRFEHVVVNQGQHYNPSSYVFTCPKHGLYMFSFSIYSHDTGGRHSHSYRGLSAALMLDGVKIAEVYTYNGDPIHAEHQQAGTTAVVDCPAGGKVSVLCIGSRVRVWGSVDIPRSIFTGFAILFF